MNKTTILAISAALLCVAGQVGATPITGQINFGGFSSTLDTPSTGTATEVTSWGSASTGGGSGILAADDSLSATFSAPWAFNSGSVPAFITFGAFTFDLTGSSIANQIGTSSFGFVSVSGTGWLSAPGYDATAYKYTFSANNSAPISPGDEAFSANISPIPDGGTTAALLGGALTALGLIRRKLVA